MPGRLELSRDDSGEPCHRLDGRRVDIGTALDLLLSARRWLRCQYRWNGEPDTLPVFSVVLGGEHESRRFGAQAPEGILRLELDDAVWRWPASD